MESLFILVLLGVLFFEHGKPMLKEAISELKLNPTGLFKYLGSASVFAITLSSLPILLLTIYMRDYGFFAYEIFSPNNSSIGYLSANIFVNYLMLTFGLFVSGVLFAAKADKITLAMTILVNAIFVLYFVGMAFVSDNWILVVSMLFFCIVIAGYIYFWVSNGIQKKAKFWWVPIVFSFVIIFLPIIFHNAASAFTKASLYQMKAGGMNVNIFNVKSIKEDKEFLEGFMYLRTEDNIYFKPKDSKKIMIVKSEYIGVEYDNKPNN